MDRKDNAPEDATGSFGADMTLLRLAREMRLRVRSRMPLGDVLRELGERMAADAVLLIVPGCRLQLAVGVQEKEISITIATEFDALAARLVAQAEQGEGLPRVSQGEHPPAACRLVTLPVDAGSGRIPAWIAFARELGGPRFDPFSALLAQIQGMRFTPRLMRELGHDSGHLSRAGLRTVISQRYVDAGALVLLDLDGLRTINHTQGVAIIAEKLQRVLEEVEVRDHPDLPELSLSAGVAQ